MESGMGLKAYAPNNTSLLESIMARGASFKTNFKAFVMKDFKYGIYEANLSEPSFHQ